MHRTPACYAAACLGGETVALAAEPVTISLRGYTDSMRCTWVITGVPPIEVEFISFANVENFVTVYRGNGTDVWLRQFSGRDLPARLRVGASTMTVTLTSGGGGNQDGFVAVLTAAGGCSRRRLGPATELWLHRSGQASARCVPHAMHARMRCSHTSANSPPFPPSTEGVVGVHCRCLRVPAVTAQSQGPRLVRACMCLPASPWAIPCIMFASVAVAAPTLAPTPAPSNAGDTWVPTSAPTCMPEHVAYAAAHDGLVAWLNRALKGLCHRTLHVSLPSGPVPLGDAGLDPLPPGLRLVLRGSGRPAAGATALDFGMAGALVVSGNDVRVEFSDMSLVNVRCAVSLPAARLAEQLRAFVWRRSPLLRDRSGAHRVRASWPSWAGTSRSRSSPVWWPT